MKLSDNTKDLIEAATVIAGFLIVTAGILAAITKLILGG